MVGPLSAYTASEQQFVICFLSSEDVCNYIALPMKIIELIYYVKYDVCLLIIFFSQNIHIVKYKYRCILLIILVRQCQINRDSSYDDGECKQGMALTLFWDINRVILEIYMDRGHCPCRFK